MSNFQKIYDEEFWMICNLPKQDGQSLLQVFLDMQNKDTQVKKGYRIKPVTLLRLYYLPLLVTLKDRLERV